MAIEQLPHSSCTSAWGLQWFSPPMPTVLLITLRGHALLRWEQETGFPWGSRSRNRTNKRCVLAADLPVECAAMFAEWLLASASQVHWTADHRKVLSRPTADHFSWLTSKMLASGTHLLALGSSASTAIQKMASPCSSPLMQCFLVEAPSASCRTRTVFICRTIDCPS